MGRPLQDFHDFSANINPLGVTPSIKEAIEYHLPYIIHYPDAQATLLKQAISEYYRVPLEQIILGNGAVELLYLICHIVRPQQVLIPAPTFSEYERAARSAGAQLEYCVLHEADSFAFCPATMMAMVTDNSIIFVGNPNNPTGTLIARDELIPLIEKAAYHNSIVVVDESFIDFLPDDNRYTCRALIKRYPNLVVLHSMTKFYAIPGLRLGFALADEKLSAVMHASKDPWNVNSLAQAAGVAALGDDAFQAESRKAVGEAKEILFMELQNIKGLRPYRPAVNYILINIVETGLTAGELRRLLMEQAILIRDCSNYPGLSKFFIRVAVKLAGPNSVLIEALKKTLAVK